MHLEIAMPDRAGAFQLEDELRALHPLAIGHRGVWHIEVDDDGDHLAEVVDTTRTWLRAHEVDELVLLVDGAPLVVYA